MLNYRNYLNKTTSKPGLVPSVITNDLSVKFPLNKDLSTHPTLDILIRKLFHRYDHVFLLN